MELRVLQYFLAVAREGNITRAAQSLHLTQPTLSRQLAQMKDELGVRLFLRSNHAITLTEDGLLLKRYAQEMIALSEKARQDLRQGKAALSGCIQIGSGEFSSSRVLRGLLPRSGRNIRRCAMKYTAATQKTSATTLTAAFWISAL